MTVRKQKTDEYAEESWKAFLEADDIRQRELWDASHLQSRKDFAEGRFITLQELKIKLGDAPPLVGVLAHPVNVVKK